MAMWLTRMMTRQGLKVPHVSDADGVSVQKSNTWHRYGTLIPVVDGDENDDSAGDDGYNKDDGHDANDIGVTDR